MKYCKGCNSYFEDSSRHSDECDEVLLGFQEFERYAQRREIAQIIRDYLIERSHENDPPEGQGRVLSEQYKGMRIACQDLYQRITGDDKELDLEEDHATSVRSTTTF